MTTAFYTKTFDFHGSTVRMGCKVTLKNDGKISITSKWGARRISDYYRMEKDVKELVANNDWTNSAFTNLISEEAVTPEIEKLITTLKEQTEPLRVAYIKHSREFASKQFYKLDQITEEQVLREKGTDFTWRDETRRVHTKASKAHWDNIRSILSGGHEAHVEKRAKLAELHYQDSIVKLTQRIIQKGLDFSKATIITDLTHFDKGNIETVISDGMRVVRAFTILAWGEIVAPHYRYLIK
jgi:hypothetical protein